MAWKRIRYILPFLAAVVTGHPRQEILPGRDFHWTRNSITYNIFRMFEVIFWRRNGIRAEAALTKEGNKYIFHCYTFEAFVVHQEGLLRASIKNLWKNVPRLERVPIYAPVFAGMPGRPKPIGYHFAIAFDNAANLGDVSSTSLTTAYTVTGSNPLIFIGAVGANSGEGGNNLTTASYAGTSATQVDELGVGNPGSDRDAKDWILPACATGSNNVVINASRSSNISGGAMSYSGCLATGQPDSHATPTNASMVTSFTFSTTVVANNCWLAAFTTNRTGVGAGTVYRCGFYHDGVDSGGTVGTGSQSMIVTNGTAQTWQALIVSIAPAISLIVRSPSDSIMNAVSRLATVSGTITKYVAALSMSMMNATSRFVTLFAQPSIYFRNLSVSMMNSVSRTVVLTTGNMKILIVNMMNAAGRLTTLFSQQMLFIRNLTVNMMYAVNRLTSFLVTIPGTWAFRAKNLTSWAFRSKNNTSWTFRTKNPPGAENIPSEPN